MSMYESVYWHNVFTSLNSNRKLCFVYLAIQSVGVLLNLTTSSLCINLCQLLTFQVSQTLYNANM